MLRVHLSLRGRIALAAVAIAVIHSLFYAVPRVWCSQPRFYADAYADAIRVLKEEFGEAAVDRGVISVPRDAIIVPWRAEAAAYSAVSGASVFISVSGRSYLVGHLRDRAVECAQVSRQDARRAYAALAYIERVQTDGGDVSMAALGSGLFLSVGGSELSERSWPWLDSKRLVRLPPAKMFVDSIPPPDPRLSTSNAPGQISELVCDMARARFIEDLGTSGVPAFSRRGKTAFAALNAVMRPAVPPMNKWDRLRIESLERDYLTVGGRKSLPLLKTVCAGPQSPWYTFLARYPAFRRIIRFEPPEGRLWPISIDIFGEMWALEEIDGRSDEEQLKLLAAAAFPDTHQAVIRARTSPQGIGKMRKARALLQQRFPNKWRVLITEKYAALPDKNYPLVNNEDKQYWLIPAKPAPGDEAVLRWLAADTSAPTRMRAYAELYSLTHDKMCIRALEDVVASSLNGGNAAACAGIDALVTIYERDRTAFDMPAFARTVLRSITGGRANEEPGCSVINGIDRIGGAEFVQLLSDVLCEPDKVFSLACEGDTRHSIGQSVVFALGRAPGDTAFGVLTAYILRDYPDAEHPLTYDAMSAIAMRGDPRALAALRIVAARGPDKLRFPYDARVPVHARQAIIMIGVRNAAHPAEAFAALAGEERSIFSYSELRYFLSKRDLIALLADDRTKSSRAAILVALAQLRAR